MTVYNGLLPVDRFDADGIGISALPVYDSGTPRRKKITFSLGHRGHTQHSQTLSSPSAVILPRPSPRPQLWSLEVRPSALSSPFKWGGVAVKPRRRGQRPQAHDPIALV